MTKIVMGALLDWPAQSEGTWIVIPEAQVYQRIPDLLLARIDLPAFEERLEGGWSRSLGRSELSALRCLRIDRGASLELVSSRLRVSPARATTVLRSLLASSFIDKCRSGLYFRLAPIKPIASRLISVELKLSDWKGALVQARSHQMFSDAAYVAFDQANASRFDRAKQKYEQLGIGLLAVSSETEAVTRLSKPSRSPLRNPGLVALGSERILGHLLGEPSPQLPESRIRDESHPNADLVPSRLVGTASRKIEQLAASAVQSGRDSRFS